MLQEYLFMNISVLILLVLLSLPSQWILLLWHVWLILLFIFRILQSPHILKQQDTKVRVLIIYRSSNTISSGGCKIFHTWHFCDAFMTSWKRSCSVFCFVLETFKPFFLQDRSFFWQIDMDCWIQRSPRGWTLCYWCKLSWLGTNELFFQWVTFSGEMLRYTQTDWRPHWEHPLIKYS